MAEAVAELLAVPGRRDRVAGERVGLRGAHPGPDPAQGRLLRLQADLVDLAQLRRQLAGREGARAVGRVAVDDGAPVDDDELPPPDEPVGRPPVRHRAGRPRADDRLERGGLAAVGVDELLEPPGELALGPPDPGLAAQCLERRVGRMGRAAQRVELLLVLDRPQPLDEPRARHQLEPAGGERLVARVAQVRRLEAVPAGEPLADVGQQRAGRLDELDALDGAGGVAVAEVGEEQHPLGLDDERRVRAAQPRQVAHVDEVRDDQRLEASRPGRGEVREPLAQPLDARAHRCPSTRNSSASRYPSGPLPMIRLAARSATTEKRRHSSRSSTFDRCTSTSGTSSSSSASRIAQL